MTSRTRVPGSSSSKVRLARSCGPRSSYTRLGSRARPVWKLGRVFQPFRNALQLAHSGIVTDYVVWLTAGAAVFGLAMAAFTAGML